MAHEFESGFFTKVEPWHKLGVTLEEAPTTEDAFICSGLDWRVGKQQLSFKLEGMKRRHRTDMNALVRDSDNSVLGYCKDQYEIYQNAQAFEWCKPLIDSGLWSWETAGSLKEGQVCWALLKQGGTEIVPGDVFNEYLLVTWAHNGKQANIVQPTSIRVVCNNTLQASISQGGFTKIRHSSNILTNMDDVYKIYDLSNNVFEAQNDEFRRMADFSLTDGRIEEYVDTLFPIDEAAEGRGLTMLSNTNEFVKSMAFGQASGQELGVRQTLYGVFQAVSESVEHYLGGSRIQDRGAHILFGAGMKMNKQAFQLAQNWMDVKSA